MSRIKIYYDKFRDVLTFTRRKGLAAGPVAVVNVPDGTERDGDCIVLPDTGYECFPRRRVSATELYIRAIHGWGDVSVAESEIGSHTFTFYGKHKAGLCVHGYAYPCDRCQEVRRLDEKHGVVRNDEDYERRLTRHEQQPV